MGPYFVIIFRPMGKSGLQEPILWSIFDLHISKVSEEGTLWTFPITAVNKIWDHILLLFCDLWVNQTFRVHV